MSSEPHQLRVVQTAEEPRVRTGPAVSLQDTAISASTVRTAVVGESRNVTIDAPSPSRWWPTLGVPGDETPPLDRLVAAARSRGVCVPEERSLAAAERALADHSVEAVEVTAARKRLAAAGTDVEALREEVATVRGRLKARQETGSDTAAAEEALATATARLSEAETERVAAEQAHDAVQQRAREARKARERRLQLQDHVANHRRDARRALVSEVADSFDSAVGAVPGDADLSLNPLCVEGDPVTAALAAVRMASLDAPIVDDTDRFGSATETARRLDAWVVRC